MSNHLTAESNIHYFEASSMKELHECLQTWQKSNSRRILSLNIEKDQEKFCCIMLVTFYVNEIGDTHLTPYEAAMAKFQRKAMKHIGESVNFSNDDIKPQLILDIQMKLKECKTPDDVLAVFFLAHSTA